MSIETQLRRMEGYSNKLYKDIYGNWSIGIGINLADGLDDEEIQALFNIRLRKTIEEITSRWPWAAKLDNARMGALVNMAYNMGVPKLAGFKHFLAAMQQGQWAAAYHEIIDSIWHSQLPGRSMEIAEQVLTGIMKD